jgi:hypothetical protein
VERISLTADWLHVPSKFSLPGVSNETGSIFCNEKLGDDEIDLLQDLDVQKALKKLVNMRNGASPKDGSPFRRSNIITRDTLIAIGQKISKNKETCVSKTSSPDGITNSTDKPSNTVAYNPKFIQRISSQKHTIAKFKQEESLPRRSYTSKRLSQTMPRRDSMVVPAQFFDPEVPIAVGNAISPGIISSIGRADTSRMSMTSESTMIRQGLGNILALMDNGIIIFDVYLEGVYNNISNVLNQDQENSNMSELIHFERLFSPAMYSIDNVFRIDVVTELIADYSSLLVLQKIYSMTKRRFPEHSC